MLKHEIERVHPFILVLARDRTGVREKLDELERTNISFLIICGERISNSKVRYRKPIGKWDAINFGIQFIPPEARLVVFNDVDTRVHFLEHAIAQSRQADFIYCKVIVEEGPQKKFYRILDPLRRKLHVAASGELMLINRKALDRFVPLPPCSAEDTYMMFRAIKLGYRVEFCKETYVTTVRTFDAAEEQLYKTRTTLGIYQSLRLAQAPPLIRVFYGVLPLVAPLLILTGGDGRAWAMGIEQAAVKHFMKKYSSRF